MRCGVLLEVKWKTCSLTARMGLTLAAADPVGTFLDMNKERHTCGREAEFHVMTRFLIDGDGVIIWGKDDFEKQKLVVHAIHSLHQSWYLGMLLP